MNKKIVLRFKATLSEQPIIYRLVKDYDLMVNILKADINPRREGSMVMELTGETENFENGVKYLEEVGVVVELLSQTVIKNHELCTDCGACTVICPVGALFLERPSMEVTFDNVKCVVCGLCVQYCPMKAMEVKF
ncbi:MAG: 4Fe-4S binding protein [Firmicutes bacterium]|nr:4Fe-4S binding protein [Bacillota bacterium]